MRLVFLAPEAAHPVGGVLSIFEFANAMARRGHKVVIAHIAGQSEPRVSIGDGHWANFETRVTHCHVSENADMGASDFVFYFDQRRVSTDGLPLMWIQALGMMPHGVESALLSAPMPKICIATWLQEAVLRVGVPESQACFVPYGLDHNLFRAGPPSQQRAPIISMLCNPHVTKGQQIGIDALKLVANTHEVGVELFGTFDSPGPLNDSFAFLGRIEGQQLVDLYQRSLIFLTSAMVEGFGFAPIEAMACGAALVTSENGGCNDYARHEDTALVAHGYGPDVLADELRRLLDDRALCRSIADAGRQLCYKFDWDSSGRVLEDLLVAYRSDPGPATAPVAITAPRGRDLLLQTRGRLPDQGFHGPA